MGKNNMPKYVYYFGGKQADGKGDMKNLLGGKGAGLAEMTNLGGFLSRPVYYHHGGLHCFYENDRNGPKG